MKNSNVKCERQFEKLLELKLKPEAGNDLRKIFEYTATSWAIDQAEKYQDVLFAGMILITRQEELGKEYQFAKLPYRKLHINRHLIFYRVEGRTCLIIRVLHDRMNIKRQMRKWESDI